MEMDLVLSSSVLAAVFSYSALLLKDKISDSRQKLGDYQKAHRRVLFLLLEMRYAIRPMLIDVDSLAREYCVKGSEILKMKMIEQGFSEEKINKLGGVSLEEDAQYRNLIQELFKSVLANTGSSITDQFLEEYDLALSSLSEQSPLLAFKLKGRHKVENMIKLTDEYIDKYQDSIGANSFSKEAQQANMKALAHAKAQKAKELMRLFNEDILNSHHFSRHLFAR